MSGVKATDLPCRCACGAIVGTASVGDLDEQGMAAVEVNLSHNLGVHADGCTVPAMLLGDDLRGLSMARCDGSVRLARAAARPCGLPAGHDGPCEARLSFAPDRNPYDTIDPNSEG